MAITKRSKITNAEMQVMASKEIKNKDLILNFLDKKYEKTWQPNN